MDEARRALHAELCPGCIECAPAAFRTPTIFDRPRPSLVGYDLAELKPLFARRAQRRRQRAILPMPPNPSAWIAVVAFFAILALEYVALNALAAWSR